MCVKTEVRHTIDKFSIVTDVSLYMNINGNLSKLDLKID